MIYVVCARYYDSHKVVRAYTSKQRADIMAELGNEIELKYVTTEYISFARAAETDEARERWAHAIMNLTMDGMTNWSHYVMETDLS